MSEGWAVDTMADDDHVTDYSDLDVLYNDMSRAYNTLAEYGDPEAREAVEAIYAAIKAVDKFMRVVENNDDE